MEPVQEISIAHTRSILGGSTGLLFYDVTTLYFETAPKDDMRQAGFSKDGKTREAQIVLGLLVSRTGIRCLIPSLTAVSMRATR